MSKEKQIDEMLNEICTNCTYLLVCEDEHLKQVCRFAKMTKALYDAGYRKQEWISVHDRLPIGSNKGDMPENIIAYTSNGEVATGWLSMETWYLLYGDNDEHYRHGMGYVTHWMPLPEPPKGV